MRLTEVEIGQEYVADHYSVGYGMRCRAEAIESVDVPIHGFGGASTRPRRQVRVTWLDAHTGNPADRQERAHIEARLLDGPWAEYAERKAIENAENAANDQARASLRHELAYVLDDGDYKVTTAWYGGNRDLAIELNVKGATALAAALEKART